MLVRNKDHVFCTISQFKIKAIGVFRPSCRLRQRWRDVCAGAVSGGGARPSQTALKSAAPLLHSDIIDATFGSGAGLYRRPLDEELNESFCLRCAAAYLAVMSLTAAGKSFQEDAKGFTQSREHSHTVIVIGAGVAGLLAALQLSMKPGLAFHATIIADEQPPDEKFHAGAPPHAFEPLDISDEVLRFLDLVKLRTSVTPSFCHPDAQAIRSWDGKLLQWIERSQPIADTQEFRRILIKLAIERGVEFMWNTRVIDLADVGWGVVCLLSDRTQTAADLLIGCDGPRSMVRTIIEGGPDSRLNSDPSGVLAFSAEFRDSTGALNSLVDQTQHFYGPRLSAHVYSFKDGLYKFQIYVSSSIDAKTSENPADLKDGPLLPAYRNLMVLARANSPTTHLIRLLQTGTACPNLCRTVCNVRPPLRRLATGRMVVLGSASTAHDSPCFRPSNTF